ncbi:MAG: hypothetical protein IPH75_06835 [bacterium]|nr:hypothetical protein [bacterium]
MNTTPPFRFYSRSHQVLLLGLRARSATELLAGIRTVPPASIYYHTHHFLQQHHYLSPEPPNDFAFWIGNVLNLDGLSESLASVDIVSYKQVEAIRAAFIERIDSYLQAGGHQTSSSAGEEFHFISCRTFIVPTPYLVADLKEFCSALEQVSLNTLYFHVFEAPLRLKRDENDFSAWFRLLGKEKLASEISTFDPYTITLERLRKRLLTTVGRYA